MEVGEAVRTAKSHILELFREENPTNVGLEEVEFDADGNVWVIGIGFSRPWGEQRPGALRSALLTEFNRFQRDYKTVRISATDGQLLSVKSRELPR